MADHSSHSRDGRMVEMARLDPARGANDLQSLSWIVLAAGGMLGALLSGPAPGPAPCITGTV